MTAKTRTPNLEKLLAYINSQPNPREFAAALLAVAALRSAASATGDAAGKEAQNNDNV